MKKSFGSFFSPFMILMTTALAGCVSVSIPKEEVIKSTRYQFTEPTEPFQKINSEYADHAWRNLKTGNTLVIFTDCGSSRDIDLSSLENESLLAISNPQVIQTNRFQFNDREALRSLVSGNIDGVSIQMEVLNFKKNTCNYTISYFGKNQTFDQDKELYNQFIKGFTAK